MAATTYTQIVTSLRARRQGLREPLRLPAEVALAAEHGVARDTVRRALRDLEEVGAVTRVRRRGTFLQPIEARPATVGEMHLGFVPPWWAEVPGAWEVSGMLEGVTRWADEQDCRLSVIHAEAVPSDIEGWNEGIRRRRLSGLIWSHPQPEQLPLLEHTARWLPTVVLGRPVRQDRYPHVMPDYHQAARLIDAHLVGLGHERYSMVQPDHLSRYAGIWIDAIEAAYAARGRRLQRRHHLVDFKGFDRKRIAEMLLHFYAPLGREIQALVFPNSGHLQSLLACDAFREKMAGQLSVVAFDYGPYPMGAYWPGRRITHVTCGWQEVGRQAMALLALLVEGKPAPKQVRVPVSLVVGDTSFAFDPQATGNGADRRADRTNAADDPAA